MNFFRTIRAQGTEWNQLRDAMLRRRVLCDNRTDIPAEADVIAFVNKLSEDDFHLLLVVCGAMLAKLRGYDVFSLPHPPEY